MDTEILTLTAANVAVLYREYARTHHPKIAYGPPGAAPAPTALDLFATVEELLSSEGVHQPQPAVPRVTSAQPTGTAYGPAFQDLPETLAFRAAIVHRALHLVREGDHVLSINGRRFAVEPDPAPGSPVSRQTEHNTGPVPRQPSLGPRPFTKPRISVLG